MSDTITLRVPDMDCPTCAGKVDKALSRVDGIDEVQLRPTTGYVDVTFDDAITEFDQIVTAIERAGYEVVESGDEANRRSRPPAWRTRRAVLTAIGALLATVGGLLTLVFTAADIHLVTAYWWSVTTGQIAYILAAIVAGAPIVRDGYYSARQRNLDIDLLMSIAIIAAVGASLPFEAAMLAVLYSIAELLERHAMDRARSSVHELLDLSPETATKLTPTGERTVSVSTLAVGDVVAVRPGERIPIDGTVIEGSAAVDQAPITGESVPVDVSTDDEVYAGTINTDGYLEIRVDAVAADSTLARIIELVEDAETGRTEHEQFVDRFASVYTPVVLVLAIITAVGPPLVVDASWGTWFLRGLTLLVIACPCAFVISTPVSVVSGITSAARNGVLIKGGRHLEAMADVDVIAFDKTGTLTTGELAVTDVRAFGRDEETLLAIVGGLEAQSSHPIAEAIAAHLMDHDIRPKIGNAFESRTGEGISAMIDGTRYYAGSPRLFESLGFDLDHLRYRPDGGRCQTVGSQCAHEDCENLAEDVLTSLHGEGKTAILVGTADRIEGVVAIRDSVRPRAREAIERLEESGIRSVVLLTGDNEGAAAAIASEVGIDTFHASLLPEEKLEHIERLEAEVGPVAMVGDGINDAPALARATVGISMGAAGSDTAIEAADIALMGDDLTYLPYLTRLSHRADGVIRQNIGASLAVKAVLAAGAPVGIVTVVHAVLIGDMGMSLGVTGNAMRLARLKPK